MKLEEHNNKYKDCINKNKIKQWLQDKDQKDNIFIKNILFIFNRRDLNILNNKF